MKMDTDNLNEMPPQGLTESAEASANAVHDESEASEQVEQVTAADTEESPADAENETETENVNETETEAGAEEAEDSASANAEAAVEAAAESELQGEEKPSQSRKKVLMRILEFVIIVAIVAFVVVDIWMISRLRSNGSSGSDADDEYVTLEEYEQIETGMSYREVQELIGSEGSVTSEFKSGGFDMMIVAWYTDEDETASISVTFTDGYVAAKSESGLE